MFMPTLVRAARPSFATKESRLEYSVGQLEMAESNSILSFSYALHATIVLCLCSFASSEFGEIKTPIIHSAQFRAEFIAGVWWWMIFFFVVVVVNAQRTWKRLWISDIVSFVVTHFYGLSYWIQRLNHVFIGCTMCSPLTYSKSKAFTKKLLISIPPSPRHLVDCGSNTTIAWTWTHKFRSLLPFLWRLWNAFNIYIEY